MRILKACALVSVRILAAASLVLVAMGYSIRLEAPVSDARNLAGGAAEVSVSYGTQSILVLLDDGSVYALRASSCANAIDVIRMDVAGGGSVGNLPIPIEEVVFWDGTWVIGADGVVHNWHSCRARWIAAPLPAVPVGASTGSTSGVKGRYRSGEN